MMLRIRVRAIATAVTVTVTCRRRGLRPGPGRASCDEPPTNPNARVKGFGLGCTLRTRTKPADPSRRARAGRPRASGRVPGIAAAQNGLGRCRTRRPSRVGGSESEGRTNPAADPVESHWRLSSTQTPLEEASESSSRVLAADAAAQRRRLLRERRRSARTRHAGGVRRCRATTRPRATSRGPPDLPPTPRAPHRAKVACQTPGGASSTGNPAGGIGGGAAAVAGGGGARGLRVERAACGPLEGGNGLLTVAQVVERLPRVARLVRIVPRPAHWHQHLGPAPPHLELEFKRAQAPAPPAPLASHSRRPIV